MIYSAKKDEVKRIDINKELLNLKGELDDKEAKITLARFLRHNLGLSCELISGFNMASYQEIALKAWFNRNYCLNVWGRGCAKSTMAAVYCYLKCIFEPGTKILIAGPTFRTARNIFTELEKIVNNPNAQLLAQAFNVKEPSHKNDLYQWNVNGGSIVAIPLNGEKIRGFRCNVLILDEFLLLSEDMVKNVLMPFLVAPSNIAERLKVREIEDDLVKDGTIKEEDRTIFGDTAQMIALSSASFTFENLFKIYKEWLSNIYDDVKRPATYFVSQIGFEAIPQDMIVKSVIAEASAGGLENPTFLREYCAQFTDGSDGYFSAKKMQDCTIPDGEEPHLKLLGDKDKKYILAIDPNLSNSESADYFAIAVMELDDETKTSTLVHNYADAGGDLKDHIAYFHYLYEAFNPVFIVSDSADGNFIPSANGTELFIDNKINLKFIESWNSDLEGEDYDKMLKDTKREFNKEAGKICIKQYFTSEFIRKGHENLQYCIDYKRVWFGSKIRPDGSIFEKVRVSRVPKFLFEKPSKFSDIGEFIDEQDEMIYNVKKQCALIEVKTTARGTQSFDLPQHLKRSKDPARARKDNMTALMLGAWGVKVYYELMDMNPEQVQTTFAPMFI